MEIIWAFSLCTQFFRELRFKGDAIIRYYGITDWSVSTNEQAFVIQLRMSNNGTTDILFNPESFTLLDQSGRIYIPTSGFEPIVVAPGRATDRVLIGFEGIPLTSWPAKLAFDNQVIIDLEKDQGQLSDAQVYGTVTRLPSGFAQPSIMSVVETPYPRPQASRPAQITGYPPHAK
jgi:hypothetical protein